MVIQENRRRRLILNESDSDQDQPYASHSHKMGATPTTMRHNKNFVTDAEVTVIPMEVLEAQDNKTTAAVGQKEKMKPKRPAVMKENDKPDAKKIVVRPVKLDNHRHGYDVNNFMKKCDNEIKVHMKKIWMSAATKPREEIPSNKSLANTRLEKPGVLKRSDGEVHVDKKRVLVDNRCLREDGVNKRNGDVTTMKIGSLPPIKPRKDIPASGKTALASTRVEVPNVVRRSDDVLLDKKRIVLDERSGKENVFQKRNEAVNCLKKPMQFGLHEKVHKMRSALSNQVKDRDLASYSKKSTMDKSDSTLDRKRNREQSGFDRMKGAEIKHINGKKRYIDYHKQIDKRTRTKGDQVLTSKSVARSGEKMDDLKSENLGELGKVCARREDERHKSHESRMELKSDLSIKKPGEVCKEEGNSSLITPPMSIPNSEEAIVDHDAAVEEKISEKIKSILLAAGWKIDLRPRSSGNSEDQVYIPPSGESGYWTITKSYPPFLKKSNYAFDAKKNNFSGKSLNKSSGSVNDINVIAAESPRMLKRNVVNKMKRSIGIDKIHVSRSKKLKENTNMELEKSDSLASSNTRNPIRKSNTKQTGRGLLVVHSNQRTETRHDNAAYAWKRTILSWMIDLGVVPLNGKIKYMKNQQPLEMFEGEIVRDGIICSCCGEIVSLAKFESHAGSKQHGSYENIFVDDSGISLLQCQLKAWKKQIQSEHHSFYTHIKRADTCGICGDGGDLISCHGCPSTFHQSCFGIKMLPPGDWHCKNCLCRFCGLTSEASRLLSCCQCDMKYHKECIPKEDATITISSNLFCGSSCQEIFRRLKKLLGVDNSLEGGLSWCLIRRLYEDPCISSSSLSKRAECNSKVAVALGVMKECLLPFVNQRGGVNLIHNVVYNCGGFYTFALERGDEIISVASVRIHGTKLAEMPFIGTRMMYRRQGLCRRLLKSIEATLCSLGIRQLIIPATSDMKDVWTSVFGFQPLSRSEEEEVKSMNFLVLSDTDLFHKLLLDRISSQPDDQADKMEPGTEHHDTSAIESEASVFSVGPNPHSSDECVVLPEVHVDGSIKSSSPESYEPHALESLARERRSFEGSANSILCIQPGAVCHDEPVGGDNNQVGSLSVSMTEFPFDDDVKMEDVGVVEDSYAVKGFSAQQASRVYTTCTSPDGGVNTSLDLPRAGATLLTHKSETHIMPLGNAPDSGGNVPLLDSICAASYHSTSDWRSSPSVRLTVTKMIDESDMPSKPSCFSSKRKFEAIGDTDPVDRSLVTRRKLEQQHQDVEMFVSSQLSVT